jgi:hypothetical protein
MTTRDPGRAMLEDHVTFRASMMTATLSPLPEFHDVDRARFEAEILPTNAPAVLRGVASGWPAVAKGHESPLALARHLAAMDNGRPVDALMTRPEEGGRLFFDATMTGFNYVHTKLPVSHVLEQILRYAQFERAPAVVVQSAAIVNCMPEFKRDHVLSVLDESVEPRAWIGTATVTPAHFDESHNIAVCVAGRRRFTLFPPEQVANLYVGPLDHAPAGRPISLVDFIKPDFERFPRARDALAHAQVAELEPGDAIYMPPLWWHHVESLAQVNMLVNYWWEPPLSPGLATLIYATAALRALPRAQREAWRHLFEHYVFGAEPGDADHSPADRRSVLGEMCPEDHVRLRKFLSERLAQ